MEFYTPLSSDFTIGMEPKSTLKRDPVIDQKEQKPQPFYSSDVVISAGTNKPIPSGEKGDVKLPSFWCTVCNVHLPFPIQALQHFTGKSHTLKLENRGRHSNNKWNTENQRKRFQVKSTQSSKSATVTKGGYDSWYERPGSYQDLPKNEPAAKIRKLVPKSSEEVIDKQLLCNDCEVMFTSSWQAHQHFKGKKHSLIAASKAATSYEKVPLTCHQGKKEDLNKFHCQHCDISMNSYEQFNQHCNGIRHKHKMGEIKQLPDWWMEQQNTYDATNTKNGSGKGITSQYNCDVCDVLLNSQLQLSQHLDSPRHKANKDFKTSGRGRGNQRGLGSVRGQLHRTKPTRGRGGFSGQNQRGSRNSYARGNRGRANNSYQQSRTENRGNQYNKAVSSHASESTFEKNSNFVTPSTFYNDGYNKYNENQSFANSWYNNAVPSFQSTQSWSGNFSNTDSGRQAADVTSTSIFTQQPAPQNNDFLYDSFYL